MKETKEEGEARAWWSDYLRKVANHQLQLMGAQGLVMVIIGAPWMGSHGKGHTMGIAGLPDLDPAVPGPVLRQMADVLDQQAKRIRGLMEQQKRGEFTGSAEWNPSEEN